MKELELKKPITAHGETLSVLEFDEPTGKDVRELGYPYQMNQMSPSDFWRMWCRNTSRAAGESAAKLCRPDVSGRPECSMACNGFFRPDG